MKNVFLDTETTNIRPGQICQISYIVDNGVNLRAVNHFLEVDEMSSGAEAIHGFSIDKLKTLSCGKRFKDISNSLFSDLKDSLLICHNIAFDYSFLQDEFWRLSLNVPSCDIFCTMMYFVNICKIPGRSFLRNYKWPTLMELAGYLGITDNAVLKFQSDCFGSDKVAHDSRYDTTVLYLCYQEAITQNILKEVI